MYKWTDAEGKVHFSDHPVDAANAEEIRIRTFSGSAEVVQDENGFGAREVKILTTTWCGVCKRAKAYLAAKGIYFSEYDVETSDIGKQEYKESRSTSVSRGKACPFFSWASKGWMVSASLSSTPC